MKTFILVLLIGVLFSASSFSLVRPWTSSLTEKTKFYASDDLEDRVDFWVKIYSQYSTTQGVFHLVDKPSVVLGEIDLTPIVKSKQLSNTQKIKLIKNEVQEKKNYLISKYGVKNPKRVRLQMGLRDRMRKALFLSGKYIEEMEEIFENEGLPKELTRLVYVESSFNINAQSKVGASGLWQIMPAVAREKGYISKHADKRNHPFYATRLAAKILTQTHKNLMSGPLAITAYNHGLTGVNRMAKLNDTKKIEKLIESKKVTRTWGFASKNFYACFLAVLEVERNAKEIFGDDLMKAKTLAYKEFRLKRNKNKAEVLKWFDGSITRFRQMNPHLNWASIKKQKVIPAGVTVMVPAKNVAMVKRSAVVAN